MKKCTLSLVLLIPSVCYAWGVDGHKIIAEIASQNLDPKTRAAVKSILGEDSIVDVCTWADSIRKQPEYIFTDGCHGVKVPMDAESFDMKRDCPDGRCAPAAIEKYAAIVRDPKSTSAQRLDALKFVIHFVSDIHCPVHAPYTRGQGNVATDVTFFDEKVSLHKTWDSALIAHVDKPWKRYAADLGRKITKEQREKWTKAMCPSVWATESHRAFVEYAAVTPDKNTLGEEYFKRSIPVVDERLSMAGVRLAAFLNKLFVEAEAAAASQPAAAAAH